MNCKKHFYIIEVHGKHGGKCCYKTFDVIAFPKTQETVRHQVGVHRLTPVSSMS